jgi:hypothetical protein
MRDFETLEKTHRESTKRQVRQHGGSNFLYFAEEPMEQKTHAVRRDNLDKKTELLTRVGFSFTTFYGRVSFVDRPCKIESQNWRPKQRPQGDSLEGVENERRETCW